MSRAYFIGGAPRTGKTTVMLKAVAKHPMAAVSTDSIWHLARQMVSKEEEPRLFQILSHDPDNLERTKLRHDHPEITLKEQNDLSQALWPYIKHFIDSNMEDGFDLLVEGVAVLPELLSTLEYDYSVVYLGNQSDQHFQTIGASARRNSKDWMHDYQDATIKSYCVFFQHFSRWIEHEAAKYHQPYAEMEDSDFDGTIEKALALLLQE